LKVIGQLDVREPLGGARQDADPGDDQRAEDEWPEDPEQWVPGPPSEIIAREHRVEPTSRGARMELLAPRLP
jgi:hypothetical protein